MVAFAKAEGAIVAPDEAAIEAAVSDALRPFSRKPGDLNQLRERLYRLMWDDVGIIRSEESLVRGQTALWDLSEELGETGLADTGRAFNLTWADWLSLDSLILTSRAIAAAANRRDDSRGAHYRSDFPETGRLDLSENTFVTLEGGRIAVTTEPVAFTRVRPGESLA